MIIRNLGTILALLHAALLLLLVILQRTHRRGPERRYPWPYLALAPFSFWFSALALPILALAPWVRTPPYVVSAGVSTTLFLVFYLAEPLWPKVRPAPQAATTALVAMTTNLYKANGAHEAIAETILASGADLVAVQELRPPQAKALAERLREAFPYQDLHPGRDAEGMGLFSRYPITQRDTIRLDGANPIQVARLLIGQQPLALINMHPRIPMLKQGRLGLPLGLSARERAEDVAAIVRTAERLPKPSLIMGDMNTTPYCPEYQSLPTDWRDAHDVAGRGLGLSYPVDAPFFGFPSPIPLFRIDHLFLRGPIACRSLQRGRMPGSDHRYLVAQLDIQPPQDDADA